MFHYFFNFFSFYVFYSSHTTNQAQVLYFFQISALGCKIYLLEVRMVQIIIRARIVATPVKGIGTINIVKLSSPMEDLTGW